MGSPFSSPFPFPFPPYHPSILSHELEVESGNAETALPPPLFPSFSGVAETKVVEYRTSAIFPPPLFLSFPCSLGCSVVPRRENSVEELPPPFLCGPCRGNTSGEGEDQVPPPFLPFLLFLSFLPAIEGEESDTGVRIGESAFPPSSPFLFPSYPPFHSRSTGARP